MGSANLVCVCVGMCVCVCVCVYCCACLLRGGSDYSLLQPVRLLLEVFTRLMVPQQVLLHLPHKAQHEQTKIQSSNFLSEMKYQTPF